MTKSRIENGVRVVTIEPEPESKCELCGKITELRPYGPSGEKICFECGMKNPEVTARRFAQVVLGEKFDA